MGNNVCCPQLEVVSCSDTAEHNHLVCLSWQSEGEDVALDNEHVRTHCLQEGGTYVSCPYYPKLG